MPDRAPTAPLLAALAVVLTWGLNFPLSKALFNQVGAAGFLGLRYLLMPLCAVALLCWRFGRRWPRLDRAEIGPLVLPTLDAANILFNVLKISSGQGVTVGPILLGAARPVHILTPSATVRRIVNMTALAVADVREARG